jgi:hypothetical protein
VESPAPTIVEDVKHSVPGSGVSEPGQVELRKEMVLSRLANLYLTSANSRACVGVLLVNEVPAEAPAPLIASTIFLQIATFSKWAMPYRTSDLLLVREKKGVSGCCSV